MSPSVEDVSRPDRVGNNKVEECLAAGFVPILAGGCIESSQLPDDFGFSAGYSSAVVRLGVVCGEPVSMYTPRG